MLRKLFGRDFDSLVRKADAARAASDWGTAKLTFEKALAVGTADAEARAAVEAKLLESKTALAEVNLSEAALDLEAGDPAQAIDRLHTAWSLLADEGRRAEIEGRIAELRRRHHLEAEEDLPFEDLSRARPFDLDSGLREGDVLSDEERELVGADDDRFGEAFHERFELAILGMDEALAERYTALGDDFARAYLTATEEDHEGALAAFEALGRADDPIVAYERGKILLALDRSGEAEAALRVAVERDPEWLDAALVLAELLRAEDRPSDARVVLEGVRGAARASIEHPLALAECEVAEERIGAARAEFERALAMDASDWRAHAGLGRCAETAEDVNGAWRHYGAAVARAPRNPALRLRLADVIARHPSEFDKALDQYNQVLRMDPPDKWRVYAKIAELYGRKGWHRQAIEVLEKALATLPEGED
ncbi:MAG: hypothetical protein KC466_19545, partial [Myxococcales bacterium]|nr:hypothetical protein [Myxococcales bacterium]